MPEQHSLLSMKLNISIITCLIIKALLSSSEVIYPNKVCVIGDVQADYNPQRDPRTLMGTYVEIDDTGLTFDETIVDTSAPIYEHIYQGNITSDQANNQYLFKVQNIGADGASSGWSLSETLPVVGETVTVFLTCFEDSLFKCVYNQWFWGYNKCKYAIPTLKVLAGQCSSFVFCI